MKIYVSFYCEASNRDAFMAIKQVRLVPYAACDSLRLSLRYMAFLNQYHAGGVGHEKDVCQLHCKATNRDAFMAIKQVCRETLL